MFRALLLFALLGAAAAFAPRGAARTSSTSLKMSDLIGASPPVGFFDPLGLSNGKDEETMRWYRAAELKHGRISMLATLGVLFQGTDSGIIPNPAFHETNMFAAVTKVYYENPAALAQITLAIAAVEVLCASIESQGGRPGDFNFDPANIRPKSEEALDTMQLKELKNGRLAMLGIAGMAYQAYLTGQGTLEQLNSGHISPFGDGQGVF